MYVQNDSLNRPLIGRIFAIKRVGNNLLLGADLTKTLIVIH